MSLRLALVQRVDGASSEASREINVSLQSCGFMRVQVSGKLLDQLDPVHAIRSCFAVPRTLSVSRDANDLGGFGPAEIIVGVRFPLAGSLER